MNFPTFGGHFSTVIPSIHQFAAKFPQDNAVTSPNPPDNSNKYTANGIPSFTQHHHATPQQIPINDAKYLPNCLDRAIFQQQQHNDGQQHAPELSCTLQHQDKQNQKVTVQQAHSQLVNANQPAPSSNVSSTWLTSSGATVANYLSQLPASTLPLSLHHFLKYSAESIKKETSGGPGANSDDLLAPAGLGSVSTLNVGQLQGLGGAKKKKKKKSEREKEPKPKPGEIRLTTALDGSTLFCCPECHMAYPEKELLEQHLVGHTMERRFVCDICGAGLKRKDHLTRHKQSHNPERPFVCTVCLKAFKRKEQLTLHFVIHSGEKRHVCSECGKGFYRKDHLRKHTRSHIARRVKAELSQQGSSQTSHLHVPASTLPHAADNAGILL